MKLKPLGDRLIVRAIEEEEATASGLVLPDTAKEKLLKGKVIAVGDGRLDESGKRTPLDIEADDEVLYNKYGGTEIKIDGEDLLVLRESDVLGKKPVVVHGRRKSSLVKPEEAKQLDDLRQDVRSKITRLRALAK